MPMLSPATLEGNNIVGNVKNTPAALCKKNPHPHKKAYAIQVYSFNKAEHKKHTANPSSGIATYFLLFPLRSDKYPMA